MSIDLATLGFTKDELQERVVERICEQLLTSVDYDPDSGDEYPVSSTFQREIEKRIKETLGIGPRVDEPAGADIKPIDA